MSALKSNRRNRRKMLQFEQCEPRLVLAAGPVVELGPLNSGIGVRDNTKGRGYVMFSEESVHTRFAANPPAASNSDHLIAVRQFGGQWEYNNNTSWYVFTPDACDRLLATLDFDFDLISSLEGTSDSIGGIASGYIDGDLTYLANVWNGGADSGEFSVTGTSFVISGSPNDTDDQISEATPIAYAVSQPRAIGLSQDVDLFSVYADANQQLNIAIESALLPSEVRSYGVLPPALRLFDASGTELATGSPTTGTGYVLDAGSFSVTKVDPSGLGIVELDLEMRKIDSTNVFYVDEAALPGGDGSSGSPFDDIGTAITQVNLAGYDDAILNAAAGTYTWGAIEPEFDMMLVGAGIGQTIIQGSAGADAGESGNTISLYIDGVSMWGGDFALDARNGQHLTLVDSEFAFAGIGDGVNVFDFASVVVYNSIARNNYKDGLSYENLSGEPMEVLEFGVSANDNGQDGAWNSQGSTTHSSVDIIRVNSEYRRNPTNIGDVSSGTSWNVNITTSDALHADNYNFYLSGGGSAWFVSGDLSVGGDIQIQTGATGYYTSLFDVTSHSVNVQGPLGQFTGPDDSALLSFENPPSIDYTVTQPGTYYVGVSSSGNMTYDPNSGGGDLSGNSVGPYSLVVDTSGGSQETFALGPLGRGIQVIDSATGTGYLMYSVESVHTRFVDPHPKNSDHLIAVRYENGQWEYNNNTAWLPFTPDGDDRLLATVDFDNDTVSSLQGTGGEIAGIGQGFIHADLEFLANFWNGGPNLGEFTVTGTFFMVGEQVFGLGDINNGVAAYDLATGTGFMMYSTESVHTRFAANPVQPSNSDRLVTVRYNNGTWQYNNNDDWFTFTPVLNDRLLAAIDFDADTITSLKGSDGTVFGIERGFAEGDLTFSADVWRGIPNDGEFYVTGTFFTVSMTSGGSIFPLGSINNGIAVYDSQTGTGFLMYTTESVHTRFAAAPPIGTNSDQLIAVRYADGSWQYNNNNSVWNSFSPAPDDRLLATLDFDADTITSLEGAVGSVFGIERGFVDGDLTFAADTWKGVYNEGEFYVTGTFFTASSAGGGQIFPIGDIDGGIAVYDSAVGAGYLMYSTESVHTRFAANPPNSSNSDHLIAVRYESGQWQYNNNADWYNFTPTTDDRLLATIDFDADTIASLQGSSGNVFGIEQGYIDGDLIFAADSWRGVFNEGEFYVTGTYFMA